MSDKIAILKPQSMEKFRDPFCQHINSIRQEWQDLEEATKDIWETPPPQNTQN